MAQIPTFRGKEMVMTEGDDPNDPQGAPAPERRPQAPPKSPVVARRSARFKRKPAQLELGSVLTHTFGLAMRDAPIYLAFAVAALVPWFLYEFITQGSFFDALAEGRMERPRGTLGDLLANLLRTSGQLLLMGAVSFVVVERLRGARPNYGRAVSVSFSRIVSMLAIAITVILVIALLSFVVTFIAFQFFGRTGNLLTMVIVILVAILVIACVLFTRFCTAIPVTIMERRPAFKAMARSDMLTKGVRWKIVAAVLLVYLLPIAVITYFSLSTNMVLNWKAVTIAGFVSEVIFGILLAVLFAVIYHDTRTSSEGVDATQIASVFS